MQRILRHEPIDRIGLFEHFWGDTHALWQQQGHIRPGENMAAHFGFDMDTCWAFNLVADLDFERRLVGETAHTATYLDGNGATLRWKKDSDGTPEHVDFTVKERSRWEALKPLLQPEERRINWEGYRTAKARCRAAGRFFCWSGVNVFESMHPVCGHEYMLMGMALDPDWITDMAATYADLTIHLMEILFAKEGKPDGIWFYEDMGYKGAPFLSPQMYRELLYPSHKKTIDFAHSLGLPVIMHSCGFIEPLLPGMVEAGIDALQAMEIKSGIDPLRIYRQYGEKIALMGGIDIRALCSNDKAVIDRELVSKIPALMQNNGYILHTDHSIPKNVSYESYCYFIDKGLALGAYC